MSGGSKIKFVFVFVFKFALWIAANGGEDKKYFFESRNLQFKILCKRLSATNRGSKSLLYEKR